MNKELPSDILKHISLESVLNLLIYLISFGGNGSNVMPSPYDSRCSGWKDPVGKTGTLHRKEPQQLPSE